MKRQNPMLSAKGIASIAEEMQNFILLWFTSVIIITVVKELYAGAS